MSAQAMELEVVKPAQPQASEAAALISMIERAVTNPDVDIDKMERLLQMHERVLARNADIAFSAAMSAAQAEMSVVATDAINPQTKSRYATYAQLDKALRPIYSKHGFALSFDEAESPKPEHVRVVCYVSHSAGHSRNYHKDMPADGKGAKGGDVMTKTHATGAAQSYGMRYLLKGIFNVAVGEDDRDGNAPPAASITDSQADEIRDLIEAVEADVTKFCNFFKVENVSAIPAKRFDEAVKALRDFGRKNGARA